MEAVAIVMNKYGREVMMPWIDVEIERSPDWVTGTPSATAYRISSCRCEWFADLHAQIAATHGIAG